MNLGKAIEHYRKAGGLSQAELARRIGVDRSTICNNESGAAHPSLHNLERIAAALGVRLCELIARAEGVAIVVASETAEQRASRRLMESLDAQDRYRLDAIAAILADKAPDEKKRGG